MLDTSPAPPPISPSAAPVADSPGAGQSARAFILLSIGAAVITITLKVGAFLLTDSVGLFSDAAESLINLVAAVAALAALTVAERPPDAEHRYGHTKAEYFSSGLEGGLILVAGVVIAITALNRLLHPEPLENLGWGMAASLAATAINGVVGLVLLRAGRRLDSITLRADGLHLLTDVWTSAGVLLGVLLVALTGWLVLDPLVALLVALNIAWTAIRLVRESAHGLLDTALPLPEQQAIEAVLARYQAAGVGFHALRSRTSGRRRFVSMHVLVPGMWTIKQGHDLAEQIEADIRRQLPRITIFTHLEPQEDPVSWEDQELDRAVAGHPPAGGDAPPSDAPRSC
jgi:cation diffusion facilitator family transporter